MKYLGHIIWKDGLENCKLRGHTEVKRDRRIQLVIYLTEFYKWISDQ